MPPFPGMGYPLVPGYESVGRVVEAGSATESARRRAGLRARRQMLRRVRGLFGGAASRAGGAGHARRCRSTERSASTACCWRWPRPPTMPSRRTPARRRRTASSATACSAGCWRGSPSRCGGDRRGLGDEPARADGADRLPRDRSRRRSAPRLPHASTTSAAMPTLLDTLDRAPRAGRRDRARRLLQRAARPSPSRRPSCARRASASPPNGSQSDLAARQAP